MRRSSSSSTRWLGSLLILIALIYLFIQSGGFRSSTGTSCRSDGAQILMFLAFLIAFAVKVPMWPVHTWLPDAHVEAPTGGSIVLAAIMPEARRLRLLRFSLPITPDASHDWPAWSSRCR